MQRISFSGYVDCFGRGVCEPENNFHCRCNKNHFGDCRLRECPKSLYWAAEMHRDNVAHERMVECGGIGVCNYERGKSKYLYNSCLCVSSLSWAFDVGICLCPRGFEGAACERMTCPGVWTTQNTSSATCMNKGRCLSLRNIAAYQTDSSDNPTPVLYGSKVRDMQTWDADRIHMCLVDKYGYFYDENNLIHSSKAMYNLTDRFMESRAAINERFVSHQEGMFMDYYSCPKGFNRRKLDPLIPLANITAFQEARVIGNTSNFYSPYADQFLEIQSIRCAASYGSFKLTFRGHTSARILANETIPGLQKILESIPTLGKVSINSTSATVCTTRDGGARIWVRFDGQLDKSLPLLQTTDVGVYGFPGLVEVTRVQTLAVDLLEECAGHGVCDQLTGLCRCWDGWGSSDGLGGEGTHGDCGRYLLT